MLFRETVVLSHSLGLYVSDVFLLAGYILIFVIFFVIIDNLLIAKDKFLSNIIFNKEYDAGVAKMQSFKKAPRISTEDLSVFQFQKLRQLRKKETEMHQSLKPSYKRVVKVKLNKEEKRFVDKKLDSKFEKPAKQSAAKGSGQQSKEAQSSSKKSRSEARSEEEDLIMSIELENRILELRSSGMKNDQIFQELRKEFDEDDIKKMLSS